jgi:L-alanine-DL-glutamate epimerase-like enolase superfamily enzyme
VKLSIHKEFWPASRPFRIAGRVWTSFDAVIVEIADGDAVGRGEGIGVFYLGDTLEGLETQIQSVASQILAGADRTALLRLLPPGGARNALDCALWDLEAKRASKRVWDLAGISARPLETVYTIGIEATPELMAQHASEASRHGLLKVKLDGTDALARMKAIRAARPDARIVVDANQGWNFEQLQVLAPAFSDLGVQMIEQPLPRGGDAALEKYQSPVPLGADESCLHLGELDEASRRYQMINIKLDKAGGLTHGIELARAARERGLGLMVGCMGGTSLAMAPSFVLGCIVDLVDIDGPLLLKQDRLPGMTYNGGRVDPPEASVWG